VYIKLVSHSSVSRTFCLTLFQIGVPMDILYDIRKSLREAPPSAYDKHRGVKYEKRIVVNRKNVYYNVNDQIRALTYNSENVKSLVDSYHAYSHIYSELPIQISRLTVQEKIDLGTNCEFILRNGYNRSMCFDMMGIDTCLADEVSFATPLDRLRFCCRANWVKLSKARNTADDIANAVQKAIDIGALVPDFTKDGAVASFMNSIVEPHRKIEYNKAFKIVQSSSEYKRTKLRPLDGDQAKNLAQNINVPCTSNEFGYVKKAVNKNVFYDAMKLALDKKTTVKLTGYVDQPVQGKLDVQRQSWLRQFDDMVVFWQDLCESATGIRPSPEKFPIKYNGFLPQDETPDLKNGGTKKEMDLVVI